MGYLKKNNRRWRCVLLCGGASLVLGVSACKTRDTSSERKPKPGAAGMAAMGATGAAGTTVGAAKDAGLKVGGAMTPTPRTPAIPPKPLVKAPDGTGMQLCGKAPTRMSCIPGGPFIRGYNKGRRDARPEATIWLQTYYMDQYEVTYAEYQACVKAGRCKKAGPNYNDYDRPKQPIVGVSWYDSVTYCKAQGKHLPTEAQWEKAARGPSGNLYPWGNEYPTCKRAIIKIRQGRSCGVKKAGYGPEKGRTFVVGSRPPGVYGLYDMAGNSWEWVYDWYSKSYAACGKDCEGTDPRGPCQGADKCPRHRLKVVRGGSWYWEASLAAGWFRRTHVPSNRPFHHFGFRCSASLAEAQAMVGTQPVGKVPIKVPPTVPPKKPAAPATPAGPATLPSPPLLGAVTPLSPAQRALFVGSPLDPAARKLYGAGKNKEGRHYFFSDERNHQLWYPHLKNLGGAYLGIGGGQGYLFMGWMRPQVAWMIDYDPWIIWLHRIYQILLLTAPNGNDFIKYWDKRNLRGTLRLLDAKLAGDPERTQVLRTFRASRHLVIHRLHHERAMARKRQIPTYLADLTMYKFVQDMIRNGRVRVMLANLLADKGLRGIGEAARTLKIPIRALYLSNAEEYWNYGPQFRKNMSDLFYDGRSVVLRARSSKRANHDYVYNVQSAQSFVSYLGRPWVKGAGHIVRRPTIKNATHIPLVITRNLAPAKAP